MPTQIQQAFSAVDRVQAQIADCRPSLELLCAARHFLFGASLYVDARESEACRLLCRAVRDLDRDIAYLAGRKVIGREKEVLYGSSSAQNSGEGVGASSPDTNREGA